MDQIKVHVEVEVNPTESEEKVKRALWNLFGDLPTETKPAHKGSTLTADAQGQMSLATLKNLLHRDHIRDAARKALLSGTQEGTIRFYLNKQVAFAGHISFSEELAESPLGPIKIEINCENPRELIDWIAAKTTKT
ncbi:MAG TPA: RNA-binding domain-containing protein [Candidatus Bathyarchaeia archaeon]|nr:RNA-binding domain-containing protein [Candidatus Bathyarchaeia archaeon]